MKRKLMLVMTIAGLAVLFTGCGDTKKAETGTTEAENKQETAGEDLITLPEYKGTKVEVEAVNVTPEEIEAYIQSQLQANAESKEVTDRAVQDGDTVNIDFEGKKDGVAFEGGTSGEGGSDLTIGSGQFIPGFEEGLIGAKKGETLDLDLTFPEDYDNAELKGQAVVFTVTVNSITESVVPELSDEVAAKLDAQVKTVDEYKKKVEELLLQQETEAYHASIGTQVFDSIYQQITIDNPPADLLDNYRVRAKQSAQVYADAYQMELEDFVTQAMGMEMDAFEKQCETMAQDMVKENLIIKAIAKKEGITVEDKEITAFAEENYQASGVTSAEEYVTNVGKEEITVYLLSEKVMKKLEEYAEVTEK